MAAVTSLVMTDELYMQQALQQARRAELAGEVPVGAIIVRQGGVIASAHNQPVSLHDPTAHAEIVALRQAGKITANYRLEDCDLYVTLEPCAMCAAAMMHARIRRLVFGAADPKAGAAGSVLNVINHPQLNHTVEVAGGVLAAQSKELLQIFFRARRTSALK